MQDMRVHNVLVVTDPNLASIEYGPVDVVKESLQKAGVKFKVFSHVSLLLLLTVDDKFLFVLVKPGG